MNRVRLIPLNTLHEKWADISDAYLIGDDGCVYRRLKSGYYRKREYDYQQIRSKFGTKKCRSVHLHKAVALAFLPNPDGLTDVDHINNDKTDNRAANLQWLSHKDNVAKRSTDKRKGLTK